MPDINYQNVALFKANKIFTIVGIGLVLTGQITAGIINPGNFIMLNIKGVTFNYQIDAIEYVDSINIKEVEIGLVLYLIQSILIYTKI